MEPSNEGIVVATAVSWLVFEEVVSFDVVLVAVAVFMAVVVAVDVWLDVFFVDVVVASGCALSSTVVFASTFRSAMSAAGADNATPKRSTKIRVVNNDHRILPLYRLLSLGLGVKCLGREELFRRVCIKQVSGAVTHIQRRDLAIIANSVQSRKMYWQE